MIFGYPFINYSPINKHEWVGKKQSDRLWGTFVKNIVFNGDGSQQKFVIAEMIDKKEENEDQEELIQKALTFGYKLSKHGVPRHVQKMIKAKESMIRDGTLSNGAPSLRQMNPVLIHSSHNRQQSHMQLAPSSNFTS